MSKKHLSASEIDGVHYHFISRDEFTRLQTGDALLDVGNF